MSVLPPPPTDVPAPPGASTTKVIDAAAGTDASKLTTRGFRKALFAGLGKLQGGRIAIVDGDSKTSFGDADAELHASIEVHDPRFYRCLALGGSMGAGESYRDGYWSCDSLTTLIRIFARNLQASEELDSVASRILDWGRRAAHRMNRNTRSGSRRNIAAHYDLSNDFYALFLDETMTYSSGVFPACDSTMAEASWEKYDRICRKLQLNSNDHVVEIGTGWGGFAEHAVRHYGCRVTTTTISKQQFSYARDRFADLGMDDRIDLLLSDYRDLEGTYDKLVSIEMIEAVGHEFFGTFFEKCSNLLRPDGLFALQAITIPDQRLESYLKSVDFIQRYIFPGGCLPSIGAISRATAGKTDLQMIHLEDFAEHYGRTLRCWWQRFHQNAAAIQSLGMTDSFMRLWDYYLCYCEGGFREKQIGVCQILFQKPANRRDVRFPSLGAMP